MLTTPLATGEINQDNTILPEKKIKIDSRS